MRECRTPSAPPPLLDSQPSRPSRAWHTLHASYCAGISIPAIYAWKRPVANAYFRARLLAHFVLVWWVMAQDIQQRTFAIARRIATLGKDGEYRVTVRRTIVRQLVRSAFSVGANVEEAAAAQTKPDFVAKMAIARKECREMNYWLRLAEELHLIACADWPQLRQEAMEVSRVVAAITRNAQRSSSRRPARDI